MADIFHTLYVNADREKLFSAISTPEGLNEWWTKSSEGSAILGSVWKLHFGSGYDWEAVVTICEPMKSFELQITSADTEWVNCKVGFKLLENDEVTALEFYNSGWKSAEDHFKISSYCWAMYLRILKRYVEFGEHVPYGSRLEV